MIDIAGYEIKTDSNERWYLNGKLHREDGPALEWPSGSNIYLNQFERFKKVNNTKCKNHANHDGYKNLSTLLREKKMKL